MNHELKAATNMNIVINSYGSSLKKNGGCFLIKSEDKSYEVAAGRVGSILITTGANVSTDALKFAVENNIDVVFLDKFGNPFGRVWHSKLGSTALIRRRQLAAGETTEGLSIVKEWIRAKIGNQIAFVEKLRKHRTEKSERLGETIQTLRDCLGKADGLEGVIEASRGTLMAYEGIAGSEYFGALSSVMPERYTFDGRSRNPARDEFNAMLNYAYGVLYSHVEKACIIAGLDPYIGFLHTDDYNKKSFVFDIIEIFRVFADEPVVYLFTGRKVKAEHFDTAEGGFTLNKAGKTVLIEALDRHLEESIRYKGRNIQRRNIIRFECHRTANRLLKDADLAGV